jgi:hypothetical protein
MAYKMSSLRDFYRIHKPSLYARSRFWLKASSYGSCRNHVARTPLGQDLPPSTLCPLYRTCHVNSTPKCMYTLCIDAIVCVAQKEWLQTVYFGLRTVLVSPPFLAPFFFTPLLVQFLSYCGMQYIVGKSF